MNDDTNNPIPTDEPVVTPAEGDTTPAPAAPSEEVAQA